MRLPTVLAMVRPLRRRWSRSLTVRLTVLATTVTAVVLLVVLATVLVAFSRQIDAAVDDGLQGRMQRLQAAVRDQGAEAVRIDGFAELSEGGRVLASAPARAPERLVPDPVAACPGERFTRRDVQLGARSAPVPVRILTACLPGDRVLAVAVSLEPQDESRQRLLTLLSAAAPILLLLVAVTIGRAVRAALRPVDLLTRQAASISAGPDIGRPLPRVRGDDEIARLATTLDDMLARLSVAFARERAFVVEASHELRTPVAVLRGEIELALSDLADTAGVEESLRAARAEAERLTRLAEHLLSLARESSGPQLGPIGSCDLAEVVLGTCDRLQATSPARLVVDAAEPVQVRCDRDRLERVLSNLVVNAAQAGARTVHVRVDGVQVHVEDDGPGFPPDFLPFAFERFSRGDPARTGGGGYGLGLALVHTLVTGVGGQVVADNDSRWGGAAVRFRLRPAVRP